MDSTTALPQPVSRLTKEQKQKIRDCVGTQFVACRPAIEVSIKKYQIPELAEPLRTLPQQVIYNSYTEYLGLSSDPIEVQPLQVSDSFNLVSMGKRSLADTQDTELDTLNLPLKMIVSQGNKLNLIPTATTSESDGLSLSAQSSPKPKKTACFSKLPISPQSDPVLKHKIARAVQKSFLNYCYPFECHSMDKLHRHKGTVDC